ncbi:MAG: MBL fold metallo-hydrolase [Candidatus Korobacteraceae bacterium]|jgi:ribonuclease BN (tRNA processing enzyme)
MEVQFLGSGDAFGSGGRFNTCFYACGGASAFLVDCGASSMIALRKFGIDPNTVRTIFISHLHGDHFGGLPFFILDAQLVSRRAGPLTVVWPPGVRERLLAAMEIFFPGSTKVERSFAVDFRELEARVAQKVEEIEVIPYEVKHACGDPAFALRVTVDGKTLCYSGDTEWVEALREAAQGVDLFIAESYFFNRQVKFHLDYATLARHLPELGAKRVVLTHMGADMLARAAESGCEAAYDGMMISL